jgi:hypothetical protein
MPRAIAPALRPGKRHAPALHAPAPEAGTAATDHAATLVVVSASDVENRIAPLVEAGLAVDQVVTTPVALASLAQLLHPHPRGAVRAYAAVNRDSVPLAIVRGGVLLFAREILPAARDAGNDGTRTCAEHLAAELKRTFLFFKQTSKLAVAQLFICGDVPDLRALVAPLSSALDLEVQPLDSSDGIDADDLLAQDDDIRDHVGEFRVAWAAVAGAPRSLDFTPAHVVAARVSAQLRRRVALGLAAAAVIVLAVLLALEWLSNAPVTRIPGTVQKPRIAQGPPSQPPRTAPIPQGSQNPQTTPVPAGRNVRGEEAQPAAREGPRPRAGVSEGQRPSPPKPDVPAVPDPVVQSILYSTGRQVALVDHRVVGVGDKVANGVVIEIQPEAVVVRTARGQVRRVAMVRPRLAGTNR